MSHFEFYDLPVAFSVDEAAVRRAYLLNSKKYHPDFHTLSDDAEQARMLELSTCNNEAFKTLSDFDRRVRYVLELKGLVGGVGEDQGGQTALPQNFLMEMMEINEALMDLEFDFDAARYQDTLQAVNTLESELYAQVQPVLDTWTEVLGNDSDLFAVRDYFFKKRYLLRIKENLSKFAAL